MSDQQLGFDVVINAAQSLNVLSAVEKRLENLDRIMQKTAQNPRGRISVIDARAFERESRQFMREFQRIADERIRLEDRIADAERRRDEARSRRRTTEVRSLENEIRQLRSEHAAIQSNAARMGATHQALTEERAGIREHDPNRQSMMRRGFGVARGVAGRVLGPVGMVAGALGGFSLLSFLQQAIQTYDQRTIDGGAMAMRSGASRPDAYAAMVRGRAGAHGLLQGQAYAIADAYSATGGFGPSGAMVSRTSRMSRAFGADAATLAGSLGAVGRYTGQNDAAMQKFADMIGDSVERVGVGRLPEILEATRGVAESIYRTSSSTLTSRSLDSALSFMKLLNTRGGVLAGERGASMMATMNQGWMKDPALARASIAQYRSRMGMPTLQGWSAYESIRQQDILAPGSTGLPDNLLSILSMAQAQMSGKYGSKSLSSKGNRDIFSYYMGQQYGLGQPDIDALLKIDPLRDFLEKSPEKLNTPEGQRYIKGMLPEVGGFFEKRQRDAAAASEAEKLLTQKVFMEKIQGDVGKPLSQIQKFLQEKMLQVVEWAVGGAGAKNLQRIADGVTNLDKHITGFLADPVGYLSEAAATGSGLKNASNATRVNTVLGASTNGIINDPITGRPIHPAIATSTTRLVSDLFGDRMLKAGHRLTPEKMATRDKNVTNFDRWLSERGGVHVGQINANNWEDVLGPKFGINKQNAGNLSEALQRLIKLYDAQVKSGNFKVSSVTIHVEGGGTPEQAKRQGELAAAAFIEKVMTEAGERGYQANPYTAGA